jgi:hypothetical protein
VRALRIGRIGAGYAERPLGPSNLSTHGVTASITFAELAVAAVEEGCVGETLAAVLAGERLEHARDPAVRAALERIADDETRHAELAWRTVRWAIERGGANVAAAVYEAFERAVAPYSHLPPRELQGPDRDQNVLRAHGRLTASDLQRTAYIAVRDVVLPLAGQLQSDAAPQRAVADDVAQGAANADARRAAARESVPPV